MRGKIGIRKGGSGREEEDVGAPPHMTTPLSTAVRCQKHNKQG